MKALAGASKCVCQGGNGGEVEEKEELVVEEEDVVTMCIHISVTQWARMCLSCSSSGIRTLHDWFSAPTN